MSNIWSIKKILFSSDETLRDSLGHAESFWQSDKWAEVLIRTHQARDVYVLKSHNTERSILLERRDLMGGHTALYSLGSDVELSQDIIDTIDQVHISSDIFFQYERWSTTSETPLYQRRAPFRRFIEPTTAILDLGAHDPESLFSTFQEKGRYNTRLSQKRGVKTEWVKADALLPLDGGDKTAIEAFYDLLDETARRDGFAHNSREYYREFVEVLEEHHAGGLLIAHKDDRLHAAGIFAYHGSYGTYYYGASATDPDIRRDHAPYLIQWAAIQEAFSRGMKYYDFLGVSSSPDDKLAGVTTFKMRFGPEVHRFPLESVKIYRPFLLSMLSSLRYIRQKLKHTTKKHRST